MSAAFTLKISTANPAFEDGPEELARIFRRVADEVADGQRGRPVYDINGNTVGRWLWEASS